MHPIESAGLRAGQRGWQWTAAAWCLGALGALAAPALQAQDAVRGAGLYLQLPRGVPSCVGCHGPDPTQNRNRLLQAAERPEALLRALNTVAMMGYLRSELSDADVADLAAYLGRVLVVASDESPLALWPSTVEFGAMGPGESSAWFSVRMFNRSPVVQSLGGPPRADPALRLRHDCPAQLAPGAGCELRLQLAAAGPGDAAGAVSWPLAAGAAPLLTAWAVAVRPAGGLSVEPEALLDLGTTVPGTRVDRDVVLRNTGTVPVTLGLATLTGPDRARFALGSGCAAGAVLPAGSACTLSLSFQPAVTGSSRASLQWRSDGRNPGNLMLEGRASIGAAPAPADPPAAAPNPSPAPAPTPAPAPAPLPSGGGGCALGEGPGTALPARPRLDPVWPLMLLLALAGLCRRAFMAGGSTRQTSTGSRGLSRELHIGP